MFLQAEKNDRKMLSICKILNIDTMLKSFQNPIILIDKVRIFWEGHKIWKNLPHKIWCYWVASNSKGQ